MTLWGRYYHYSHLTEKETGVQNEVTSQGQIVSEKRDGSKANLPGI